MQHHLPADHLGLAPPVTLVLKVESSGSVALETSCLFLLVSFFARGGGNCTLQDIETDAAKLINIRMVNLSQESDLWGGHRVVVG